MTIWHILIIGNTFDNYKNKIMFKNIFNNKSKMNTENITNEELADKIAPETTQPENEVDTNETSETVVELSLEEQLTNDLAAEKDKHLRLFAEFENYKRRTAKERLDLFKTANQEVLQALLPVLDDFD